MINKRLRPYLVLSILILSAIYFWPKKDAILDKKNLTSAGQAQEPINTPPQSEIAFKEIKKGEKQYFINRPNKNWMKDLETSLRTQGGELITEVEIKHERSLIWNRDGQPLRVESVMIALTDNKKSQSHFRAMIEPQTGKILETWDKTIFEPVDKKEGFRFKLDPRYSTAN